MIHIIVFSFNRALQLHTLLKSFVRHWKNPAYKVSVLYNTSDDFFQKGYDTLIEKFQNNNNIVFYKESKFDGYKLSDFLNLRNIKHYFDTRSIRKPKSNFRSLLLSILSDRESELCMFMTDDAMYIDDVNIDEVQLNWVNNSSQSNQYVLRLGEHTNDRPATTHINNGHIEWKCSEHIFNSVWGYTFSVDAHIYSRSLIIKYLKKYIFANPNTLEGIIAYRMYSNRDADNARCVLSPKLLSFPINMVQDVEDNESCCVDVRYLNQMYLDGYELIYPVPDCIQYFQVYPAYLMFQKGDLVKKVEIGKPSHDNNCK